MKTDNNTDNNTMPVELTITPSRTIHDFGHLLDLEDFCDGKAVCGRCRVKVLEPSEPLVSSDDRRHLRDDELARGIRLACRLKPGRYILTNVTDTCTAVQVQPDELVDTRFGTGRSGPGLAVDIGTTTVMATVFARDGRPGMISVTDNLQARYGMDIIDRLAAVHVRGLRAELKTAIHESISTAINALPAAVSIDPYSWLVGVGNSAMYHLALGLDVSSLAQYPFVTVNHDDPSVIGISLNRQRFELELAAPLGGFVGSDAIAAYCAIREVSPYSTWILLDLGSNCEVVLHYPGGVVYTSAAAGPAFEGYNLSCGMKVGKGAIRHVDVDENGLHCSVADDVEPRGICGTGYIDYLARLVERGMVDETGLIRNREGNNERRLFPTDSRDVFITQRDIRELQKAKSAVALGIRAVLDSAGLHTTDLAALYIAGSFGKDLRIENARNIGLIPSVDPDRCFAVGNLALLGAGFTVESGFTDELRAKAHRISHFGDRYTEHEYISSFRLSSW